MVNLKVKVGYDNIQKVIQVLPEYIQDQFQEAFIQWALGEPVKENQVYQLEPSWPAMKETLLEETNVKPDPDTGLQLHGASGKCQVAADPKYHGEWFRTKLLLTSILEQQLVLCQSFQ